MEPASSVPLILNLRLDTAPGIEAVDELKGYLTEPSQVALKVFYRAFKIPLQPLLELVDLQALEELKRDLAQPSQVALQAFHRAFKIRLQPVLEVADLAAKFWRLETRPAADGAQVILLQPSDRLLEFLAAARAGDLQRLVVD